MASNCEEWTFNPCQASLQQCRSRMLQPLTPSIKMPCPLLPASQCPGCDACGGAVDPVASNTTRAPDTLDYSRFDNIYDSDDSEDCESSFSDYEDDEELLSPETEDPPESEELQEECHWHGNPRPASNRDVLDYSRFDAIDDSEDEEGGSPGEPCQCTKCLAAAEEADRRAVKEAEVRATVEAEKARLKQEALEQEEKARKKAEAKAKKKLDRAQERERRRVEEERLQAERLAAEAARRRAAEEDRQRRRAVEEEVKRKKIDEDKARKKQQEEDKQQRRLAEEAKKKQRAEQKEQRRKEEEARARKRAVEEEARQRRVAEERERQREKAEQERARKRALKAEKKAAEEARRKAEEEAAAAEAEAEAEKVREAEDLRKRQEEEQLASLLPRLSLELQAKESELLCQVVGSNKHSGKSKWKNKSQRSRGLAGFVFFCTNATHQECLDRRLLGLPDSVLEQMQDICPMTEKPASVLFLMNFETGSLEGVFVAERPAALNIQPEAWKSVQPRGYPAQVQVRRIKNATTPLGKSDGFRAGQVSFQTTEDLLSLLGCSWEEVQGLAAASLTSDQCHGSHDSEHSSRDREECRVVDEEKERLADEIKKSLGVRSFEEQTDMVQSTMDHYGYDNLGQPMYPTAWPQHQELYHSAHPHSPPHPHSHPHPHPHPHLLPPLPSPPLPPTSTAPVYLDAEEERDDEALLSEAICAEVYSSHVEQQQPTSDWGPTADQVYSSHVEQQQPTSCLLYTSPSPRDS
eukprot:TRINITY_DN4055_c0_g1_i5.p1 TRINITY_DN4055_c0_g1~~TRINITY_DN4055_c0_g1_i5.p1  ORF type:complete len:750 (+),score=217.41 TRINITY_DN4055_c0_g1_i5:102-2351(+)